MKKNGNYKGTEVIYRRYSIVTLALAVFVIAFVLFVIGLMMGYGILHSPFGIFNPETWTHILKLTGSD